MTQCAVPVHSPIWPDAVLPIPFAVLGSARCSARTSSSVRAEPAQCEKVSAGGTGALIGRSHPLRFQCYRAIGNSSFRFAPAMGDALPTGRAALLPRA